MNRISQLYAYGFMARHPRHECTRTVLGTACEMNPPHILIARNSRGPNTHNPSASLSSPTETHAAAAGIFRSAGSPSWYLEECESDEMASSLSTNGDMDDPIEIHETFTRTSKFPGNVKIIVESTTFWCAALSA